MLKIAHVSDLHLGYSSGRHLHKDTRINLREQDGYDILDEVISQIIEENVDLVLCSGDWFHSPKPSIYTMVKSQEQLDRLVEANIPFYNIAGNHDATDSVKDIPSNRILHQPRLGLYSFVEPYVIKELTNDVVLHLVSHHGYTAQKDTMKMVKPIKNKFNILVTHGSVFDPETNSMLHTEGEPREIIVPENVLKLDWNYILLGHIHTRGWVGSSDGVSDTRNTKIFYGGSTLRRGYSDKPCKLNRGWTLWTIDNNEMIPTFFNVHQRPQYDIPIFCTNKESIDIENEIVEVFKKVDLESTPIMRITLIDLDEKQRLQINFNSFNQYSAKCLTFSIKFKTKAEAKIDLSGENFSFDLFTAFNEYWNEISKNFEKEEEKIIKNITNKFLRDGQSEVLSK